tara:strand:- start:13149 stop:13628 length:480 start_codon:yes stop_codon:yes gene_type:complete
MSIINGPVNHLRKIMRGNPTRSDLLEGVSNFLDSINLDLDADNKRIVKHQWKSDDDAVVNILYGQMHDGTIADEVWCSIEDLRMRAAQLGKITLGSELEEEAVQAVRNLHNKGASNDQICEIMGLDRPIKHAKKTKEEMSRIQNLANKFTKQGDIFSEI